MKFCISSKELQSKLAVVSKVIQKKNTLMILDYAMVSQRDNQYYLTGASMDNQITVPFDIRSVDNGAFTPFCIDASQFLAILGTLPEQPIEIEVDETKNFNTIVRYEGGDFQLSSQSAAEFPLQSDIPDDVTAVSFKLASNILLPCVKAAQVCTVEDELRPQMSSVALDVNAEGVTFFGTDGHKLYRYQFVHGIPFLEKGSPAVILFPRMVVSALEATVSKAETVSIRTDGKRIEVVADGSVLMARTIEQKYPNCNSVIPKETKYHAVIAVRDLAMAVKRTSIMANVATGMLVLEKKADALTLCSMDMDFGRSANSVIPTTDCNLPDGFRIGFKASNLSLLLGNVATDNVRLCFNTPEKAALLKEDVENSALTELLMPMNIEK